MIDIRKAVYSDLSQFLTLYTHLHENTVPAADDKILKIRNSMPADTYHHIIAGTESIADICPCVLIAVLNHSHNQGYMLLLKM